MAMEFNECKNCGAKDGRAGLLINSPSLGVVGFCLNCKDTKETGAIVLHSDLRRTNEEVERTAALASQF